MTRDVLRRLARLASSSLLRLAVRGLENVPHEGGLLLAMNHLGDADPILVIGFAPREVEVIGKAEILRWPIFGSLARDYGMIPVRRGQPDRETLNMALDVLKSGKALLIAPEGRESRSHTLETAKGGAAFLALHSRVPIVPIAITGTENRKVYSAWMRLKRPCVTLTFGQPFTLPPNIRRQDAADLIMRRISELLPPEYRGVYGSQSVELEQ
ncbi:MAG: 1-acyl-sn-glycerol-3-phosphate acyltransferase [Chloroflexi bacterium]|nr:1-acyl-sn-glycerol-3-phosphate acyltransferase [Chloroflexota bacterium]